jgi:hypothetical protein
MGCAAQRAGGVKADRWTARRKRTLIEDVHRRTPANDGANTEALEALMAILANYGVSFEEFAEWERAYDEHGKEALKATKLQKYRAATRHVWVRKGHRA